MSTEKTIKVNKLPNPNGRTGPVDLSPIAANALPKDIMGPVSFMLVGDFGTGKSTQCRTLPGKKLVYAFDPNAPRAYADDVDTDLILLPPDMYNIDAIPLSASKAANAPQIVSRAEPKVYQSFEAHVEESINTAAYSKYDWVIIDSLTTLSWAVMDTILWLNSRPGRWPGQDDWTATINTIQKLFRLLTSAQHVGNFGLVANVHTNTVTDQQTKVSHTEMWTNPRLQRGLPILFTDILLLEAGLDDKNRAQYTIRTVGDRRRSFIRTSLRGNGLKLAPIEDVTIPVKGFDNPTEYGLGALMKQLGILPSSHYKE